MHALIKNPARATIVGATAIALLSVSHAAAGDGAFQATGHPELTNIFHGPDGPPQFPNLLRMKFGLMNDRETGRSFSCTTPEASPPRSSSWNAETRSSGTFTHAPVLLSVLDGGELS